MHHGLFNTLSPIPVLIYFEIYTSFDYTEQPQLLNVSERMLSLPLNSHKVPQVELNRVQYTILNIIIIQIL